MSGYQDDGTSINALRQEDSLPKEPTTDNTFEDNPDPGEEARQIEEVANLTEELLEMRYSAPRRILPPAAACDRRGGAKMPGEIPHPCSAVTAVGYPRKAGHCITSNTYRHAGFALPRLRQSIDVGENGFKQVWKLVTEKPSCWCRAI